MANDLLSGLGGLVKELSGFMPKDDPNVKIMNAQTELSELKTKEMELYAQIGRKALEQDGKDAFGDLGNRLALLQSNIVEAEGRLRMAQEEKIAAEKEKNQAIERCTCPECGKQNPEASNSARNAVRALVNHPS